mmetsp:Transcript_61743/g.155899  ORF Transcript_61743/g.155899 Transcript_61743/m.155899 type:complete len:253 (-) Transcript_61743:1122-1880(-)
MYLNKLRCARVCQKTHEGARPHDAEGVPGDVDPLHLGVLPERVLEDQRGSSVQGVHGEVKGGELLVPSQELHKSQERGALVVAGADACVGEANGSKRPMVHNPFPQDLESLSPQGIPSKLQMLQVVVVNKRPDHLGSVHFPETCLRQPHIGEPAVALDGVGQGLVVLQAYVEARQVDHLQLIEGLLQHPRAQLHRRTAQARAPVEPQRMQPRGMVRSDGGQQACDGFVAQPSILPEVHRLQRVALREGQSER